MRKLSFIFLVVFAFALNVSAQMPEAEQAFEEGMKTAQAGRYENALGNYRKALSLSENEKTTGWVLAKIHFNVGVCLYQLKHPAEAVGEFGEAIRLSRGKYQKAFYALGMAQSELKNWRAAETAFREALNLKKEDGEAWFDLALIFLEERDFEAAQTGFQNAIKYNSVASSDAHNNIGVIWALKGDITSAENEFETALRQSRGKSVEARDNLQFCKTHRQNLAQAPPAGLEFSRF